MPTNPNVSPETLNPPKAKTIPMTLEKHGRSRLDEYYWLSERDNPDVLAYLDAENDYARKVMAHRSKFEDTLFEEIKGRIKQTDLSVPYKLDDYYYYTRYEEGKEYPLYCRKRETLDAKEELMLDVNVLAEGHEFFAIGGLAVSFAQDLLAYAFDTQGRRIYTVRFKDLVTGELLDDVLEGVTGNLAWANDNGTLFYGRQDPHTLRAFQVFRHRLGCDPSSDVLVFEEEDETFSTAVFKTKSKQYLMIASYQTVSTEYRYLSADNPDGEFSVVFPRERFHEYDVDHDRDAFYIRTNWKAKNFRLMKTTLRQTDRSSWQEVLPHRDDVLLESFELFRDFLVAEERHQGLVRLRVIPWNGEGEHYVDFGEPAYAAELGDNYDFNTSTLRYRYASMTTPDSVYDYDMNTRDKVLLKQEEVLGGFEISHYATERTWATAADGKRIPISLVYRKNLRKAGGNPLLLYGYGAYGISLDADFRSSRLSLLDRGFVFAVAHIRGGEELGREWYETGKLFHKKNTFTDFIACGEHLGQQGYAAKDRIYAMGGSAGGLLMGAVVNMRPDLFHGVVAQVPFVDLMTTMLDTTIPLTTGEYDEWGDPNRQVDYEYMLSYSPYDNVTEQAYPHLLVTTGLHDSQVQYWEPAKWVAKLRRVKADGNRLLLKTNMDAGHGGASGRFRRYKELAFIYTFLLDSAGLVDS
ncbi:MAG: S9 family peptidase [Nitrospira sp.]|nr:S9 family peptidase [Nitrospira sp.]